METSANLYTTLTALGVALITGVVSIVTYQRSKKSEQATAQITKVLNDTDAPVQNLVQLVDTLQNELRKSNQRHEREVTYLENQVDDLRDENTRLRKIITQHERRLNHSGINGTHKG